MNDGGDEGRPGSPSLMYHYTDKSGYNRIKAEVDWRFKAHRPRPRDSDHPFGVYFTPLPPGTRHLSRRLSVPKRKLLYILAFEDAGDLTPLRGRRREQIFYSTTDYVVVRARQRHSDSGEVATILARRDGGKAKL
jgi:hypothetical protein